MMLGGVIIDSSLLLADILLLYEVVMPSAKYCNDDVVLMTKIVRCEICDFLEKSGKKNRAESIIISLIIRNLLVQK